MRTDVAQLEFIDKKLRNLLIWLEVQTGFDFVGTSIYRIDNLGVHGTLPVRGWDLRIRNKEIGLVIEKVINQYWKYDPKRPKKKCAFLHGDDSNLHLHLQVHPNTKLI